MPRKKPPEKMTPEELSLEEARKLKVLEDIAAKKKENLLLDIRLLEQRGELVSLGDMEAAITAVTASVNARLLALAAKIADRVCKTKTPAAAKKVIDTEIEMMMDDIGGMDAAEMARRVEKEKENKPKAKAKKTGQTRNRLRKNAT